MLIKYSCMTYQASHQTLCGMGLIRSILLKKLRQSYKTCVISHHRKGPKCYQFLSARGVVGLGQTDVAAGRKSSEILEMSCG